MTRLSRPRRADDVLWIACLAIVLLVIGYSSVSRTEEVAVLDTAREMLGKGFDRWMIPHVDGSARPEGPPLAYWLAAGSYKLFGVREFAGRFPFAIAGWLTALLTCRFATQLYGRRAGILAGVALLGSWLFAQHTQLAETDILSTLFVSLVIYALYRATRPPNDTVDKPLRWFQLAGLAIGLAALSKGLPAIFPLLFLVGIACSSRSFAPLARFVRSGAPLTVMVVIAPWVACVVLRIGSDALMVELQVAIFGRGATEPLYSYAVWLLAGIAPWTGLAILALIVAGVRLAYDRRSQIVFWWLAATLIPLLLVGQRQKQYLLPVLPPIMVLTGWLVDRWLRMPASSRLARTCRWVAVATATACVGGVIAIPFLARTERGILAAPDGLAIGGLVLLMALPLALRWKRGSAPGVQGAAIATVVAVMLLVGLWTPTLQPINARDMSRLLTDQFGPRQFCFYGSGDLPLAYSLRRATPVVSQRELLEELLVREPRTVVLAIGDNSQSLPELVPGLVVRGTFQQGKRVLHAYEYVPEIQSPPDGIIAGRISPRERQVNLLVTGDWGQETIAQAEVAATMSLYGLWHRPPIDAVLLVGDNFYVSLRGTDDPAWQQLFEKRFRASDLPAPFYAVLGNHDYEGNKDTIELAYAKEHPSSRWKMPARWYRVDFPPERPLVTAFMLDSNYDVLTPEDWASQKKWLAEQLTQPRSAHWTIVLAHHPLFSNGVHGDDAYLQSEWGELLQHGKVDFYLAGHDHDMQHLDIPGHTTRFLVCGGGGAEIRPLGRNDRGPFSRTMHGFTHLRFGESAMEAACIDRRGKQAHVLSQSDNSPATTPATVNHAPMQ